MARLPTWEEMQKNQGVPVEMGPLERRVDALERKVQTLMDMLTAANAGSITSQEFVGKQACEQAATAITEKWNREKSWGSEPFTICVPK